MAPLDREIAKTQQEREKMEQRFASLDLYGRRRNNDNNPLEESIPANDDEEMIFDAMETTTPTSLVTPLYEENKGQQFDVPMGLLFMNPGNCQFIGELLNGLEEELSPAERKERKIIELLLMFKNGTPPQRKTAFTLLTDKAQEFGASPLIRPILPLLLPPTLELVELFVGVLYKLGELIRPHVSLILVVIDPLLVDEDYNVREMGRLIVYNLSKAAGPATMINEMRWGIDYRDEYYRNITAISFSVVALALGIPVLLPLLKDVCQSDKSLLARHTGIKIVHHIAILMGCAVLPHLRSLVEIIEHGLKDENQEIRNITALSLAVLAEIASAPYPIESFVPALSNLFL